MQVRKATKCLFFMSIQLVDRLHCSPFRTTETPNPASQRRRGNGGTTFSGLTRPSGRGRKLLSRQPDS
jgi:hypothetical protein